jgi:hypothetical protein
LKAYCLEELLPVVLLMLIDSIRTTNSVFLTSAKQITKEIYETLSQTARFLKFNTKEKVWEEVSKLEGHYRAALFTPNLFLTIGVRLSSPALHLQISPMAARDKCGHALRFANRLKSKKNEESLVTQQKSPSNTSQVPAPGIISPTPSLSPTRVAAAATLLSHSQAALGADASQLPGQQQQQQSLVQLHSQLEQQQQQQHQQPQTSATAQRIIFGELLKRYDTMWGASHIQALAGLHASASPSTAAAAASFLRAAAAAGSLVPPAGTPHSLMHPLGAPAAAQHSSGTNAGLGGPATATVASPAVAAVAVTAPPSAPGSINVHARKATLDDLCSLLLVAKKQGS